MTDPTHVCRTFPAYAYEAQPDDTIDGRVVTAVETDGETVTIGYAEGDPTAHQREDEVSLVRCWIVSPTPVVEY